MDKRVGTVLGTNQFGSRVDDQECLKMYELFQYHGYKDVDCAFIYGNGKAEETIGKFENKTFPISTKAYSWEGYSLKPNVVRYQLETSLKRLQRRQVDIFYLHMPDNKTPLLNTLREVNNLKLEGKFKEFGICNYPAWQVAEIVNICKENEWIKPTVYQAGYTALTRIVEKELIPCLRYFNIRFYSYSPLMGGILTGKHDFNDLCKRSKTGRFFGKESWVNEYRRRYWRLEYFKAIQEVTNSLAQAYGRNKVTVAEGSLRWLYHHSLLDGRFGDAVIIGSSNLEQLATNLAYVKCEKLNDNVVKAFDEAWKTCENVCPDYIR